MFKKLNKMKIGARLKKSFRQIILIFGILSALVVVIMLYTINNYGTILDNYAYPQGDIAMAMNESAEVRAASRGIVGYDSDSLIESIKEQHEQAVKSFEEYLEKILIIFRLNMEKNIQIKTMLKCIMRPALRK